MFYYCSINRKIKININKQVSEWKLSYIICFSFARELIQPVLHWGNRYFSADICPNCNLSLENVHFITKENNFQSQSKQIFRKSPRMITVTRVKSIKTLKKIGVNYTTKLSFIEFIFISFYKFDIFFRKLGFAIGDWLSKYQHGHQ